jgi:hypothetical protein
MSKARDLASAPIAPSTVSATELGYVDGVTSAIQTQIDSKIGSASAINPTIVDAKGDIIAATAADTVARLAVGANDTVLTADSTAATGMKWAAVSGGAGNLAQIASGSLSGTTITLSSLSTYSELVLALYGVGWNTSSSQLLVRVNNNSGTNYAQIGWYEYQSTKNSTYNLTDTAFRFNKVTNQYFDDNVNIYTAKFTNCKTTGFTDIESDAAYYSSGAERVTESYRTVYKVSEAVSSLVIFVSGGQSFSAGNYVLWGA